MHSISSACCLQGKYHDPASQQGPVKAHKFARLAKIPPLACGQSAPFDKGVNPEPAKLTANAIPGN